MQLSKPQHSAHDNQSESGIRPIATRRPEPHPGMYITPNVRLVRQLAVGGMGSIWVADHLGLEAQVAVKLIDPRLLERHEDAAERFKREASMSARLSSVHVVRTFDHGTMPDGTPYIVMELLEGCCLEDWLGLCGTLSLRETALVIKQAAKALGRAHQLGIVHRDIKPDNIFLCDNDYELFVKVLDFGVAKRTWNPSGDAEMTQTGMVVGTPGYMSPEQAICSKGIDHRADLWSLAAVAYRALTGEEPYADDPDELPFGRMMRCQLTPPTHLDPTLPGVFDEWFARALHPDPDMRAESADALARSFAELVLASVSWDDADELSGELAPRSSRSSFAGARPSRDACIATSMPTPTHVENRDDADDGGADDQDDDDRVDVDDTPTRPLGPVRDALRRDDERDGLAFSVPALISAQLSNDRALTTRVALTVCAVGVLVVLGQLAALW